MSDTPETLEPGLYELRFGNGSRPRLLILTEQPADEALVWRLERLGPHVLRILHRLGSVAEAEDQT